MIHHREHADPLAHLVRTQHRHPLAALTIGTSVGAPIATAVATPQQERGVAVSVNGDTLGIGTAQATTTSGSRNLAVAINGTATTSGTHNVAIAINGSSASAGGTRSTAVAINDSQATTDGGSRNRAFAVNNSASATNGNRNTARANGYGTVQASDGNGNTAIVQGRCAADVVCAQSMATVYLAKSTPT